MSTFCLVLFKMKVNNGEILLLLAFTIRQVTARYTDISTLIYNLNSKNISPLLIVLNTKSDYQESSELSDGVKYNTREELRWSNEEDDYEDAKDQAKYLLYSYLLRSAPAENTEEEIEENKRVSLRSALRARCQARVECEKKCGSEENYCPKSCKAVFDSLNLCEPPKKKCKKEDPCAKRGKTLPPYWRY